MKKTALASLLFIQISFAGSESLNGLFKADFLTGDTKLACEAILCLSSPVRPQECIASLMRYFAIKFKKPWKTINARREFLNLCPTDFSQDKHLEIYKNEILPNVDEECSIDLLNNRVEQKIDAFREVRCHLDTLDNQVCGIHDSSGFRINPHPTRSCSLLSQSIYTDFRLKYTCPTKFYTREEWSQSKEALDEISKDEYEKLTEDTRMSITRWEMLKDSQFQEYYEQITRFYRAKPIQKNCWINQK